MPRSVGALAMACALVLAACIHADPLELIGGDQSRALAVNGHGMIVGSMVQDGQQVGMVYDPSTGTMAAVPGLNGPSGEAVDVNDQGLVVGSSYAETWDCIMPPPSFCPLAISHAYVYETQTGHLLDLTDVGVGAFPAGQFPVGSAATGINEAGVVVGDATAVGPPTVPGTPYAAYRKPFAYDPADGSVTDLSAYGFATAVDINDAGQVLGQVGDQAAVVDLATGVVTVIGTFGGTTSTGYALNDAGQVVGSAQVAGNIASHAFVYHLATGLMTELPALPPLAPAPSAYAHGISDAGLAVGVAYTATGWRPFAYDVPSGHLIDLGAVGSGVNEARDINEAGVVVGFSQSAPEGAWRTTVARHY